MRRREFIRAASGLLIPAAMRGQILQPIIAGGVLLPPQDNLGAWYQASAVSGAIGSAVSSWPDSGPNGYAATQATPARQPRVSSISGLPSVAFDGSQVLSIPTLSLASDNFSLFIIGAVGSYGSPCNHLQFGSGPNIAIQQGSQTTNPIGFINVSSGGTANSTVGLPCGTTLYGGRAIPGNRKVVINSHIDTISGSAGGSYASGLLGAYNTSGSYGMKSDIFEVLIYSVGLSDSLLAQVQAYAQAKYAINYTPTKQVVFDGNSLTAGTGATASQTYPQQVMSALPNVCVGRNVGIGGYTTTQLISGAAAKVDALYSAVTYTDNVLAVMEVRNDLAASVTKENAYANFVTYCQARRAVGWKVVAIPPIKSAGVTASDLAWCRDQIVANWATFADSLADPATDSRFNPSPDSGDFTLYIADHVHLSSAGYGAFAGFVKTQIQALL